MNTQTPQFRLKCFFSQSRNLVCAPRFVTADIFFFKIELFRIWSVQCEIRCLL